VNGLFLKGVVEQIAQTLENKIDDTPIVRLDVRISCQETM
jgi:hypothetical protein